MAEAMLIGAGIGAGGAMLSGNDPLKGAALGGAMGGATAGFGSAGVASGAGAAGGSTSMMQTLATPAATSGATAAVGNTMNPALTNGIGQSSNPFTQFSRDAYENVGQHVDGAFNGVTDTIGQGFDYLNDKTGMENKDWTKMAMSQGINSMQPDPQQQIQAAPMGQGISRPQVDLSQSSGSLLSSNPMASGAGGQQLTLEEMKMLQQRGLL